MATDFQESGTLLKHFIILGDVSGGQKDGGWLWESAASW